MVQYVVKWTCVFEYESNMEYIPIWHYGKSDEARNIFKKVKQISSTTACYYEEVCLKYHSIDL